MKDDAILQMLESIANGNRNENFEKIKRMGKRKIMSILIFINEWPELSPISMGDFLRGLAVRL